MRDSNNSLFHISLGDQEPLPLSFTQGSLVNLVTALLVISNNTKND